jgi:hypothetical protein
MGAKEKNERETKDGIDAELPDQKELAIPFVLPLPINDQLAEEKAEDGLIVKVCRPGVVVVVVQFQICVFTMKGGALRYEPACQPAAQGVVGGGPGGVPGGLVAALVVVVVVVAAATFPVVFVVVRVCVFNALAFKLKDKAGLLTGIAAGE